MNLRIKPLYLFLLLNSLAAHAWDQDVYSAIRETTVLKLGGTMSSEMKDGNVKHFSWEREKNQFAESLANKIASSKDASARAERFRLLYASVNRKIAPAEVSSFNPYLNAELVLSIAEQASLSEDITNALLENIKPISHLPSGSLAKKEKLLAALANAQATSAPNKDALTQSEEEIQEFTKAEDVVHGVQE